MECWIEVSDEADRSVVRLAGRLRGAQVPDLTQVCSSTTRTRLIIDLSDLLNADTVGIAALRQLQREGARLVGVSQYLRLKLDSID